MPKLVTDTFDATKLNMIVGQIRRAELTLDSLLVAMSAAGVESLEIAGAPELDRALKGLASFGDFAHSALRERVLNAGITTPKGGKVPQKTARSVEKRGDGAGGKKPANSGT
jgi:hypothetical protein